MPRAKEPLPLEKYDIYGDNKPKRRRRKIAAKTTRRRRKVRQTDTTLELLLAVKRLNAKYSVEAIRAAVTTYQTLVSPPQRFANLD